MRAIVEMNLLLRVPTELSARLKLSTDEFHDGWKLVRGADERLLEKQIVMRGWSFIKTVVMPLQCGVGEKSQEAVSNALKLALGSINEHCNAVKVEHIELAQYPQFFLAGVMLCSYRIQQDAVLAVPDKVTSGSFIRPQRRLPVDAPNLFPHFSGAVPMLKEMLVLSRSTGGSML